MKSNEVETTLKHPESFHGNVKNLSKMMKMVAPLENSGFFEKIAFGTCLQQQQKCEKS